MNRISRCRTVLLLLALLTGAGVQAQVMRSSTETKIGRAGDRVWLDVDGDGRDDFCTTVGAGLRCELAKADGFRVFEVATVLDGANLYAKGDLQWVDADGDGYVDLCGARYPAPNEVTMKCVAGPAFTRIVASFAAVEPLAQPDPPPDESPAPAPSPTPSPEPSPQPSPDPPPETSTGMSIRLSVRSYYPGSKTPMQFADVDGDGLPDLCTLMPQALSSKVTLRCHIAQRNGSKIGYVATAAWNRADLEQPSLPWPRGYFDFNGDGLADYCQVVAGPRLQCVTSTPTGFGTQVQSAVLDATVSEGADFVDINGDGKVDFCRLAGKHDDWHLRCVLSNGVGWEFASDLGGGRDSRERLSARLSDRGERSLRWWVDINGDGLPDFCRGSQTMTVDTGDRSVVGPLVCRLNLGETGRGRTVFAADDVTLANVDFGRSDGGRSFCDPFGTGLPTLCRISRPSTITGETCWVDPDTDQSHCEPMVSNEMRLVVGLTDVPSAQAPLLVRFADGAGAETRITYLHLTSDAVYSRSSAQPVGNSRAIAVVPRQPVVFETRAWIAGTGGSPLDTYTGNARYAWRDLLVDPQRGPRGFRERWMLEEGSNTIEHVVFFQGRGAEDGDGSIADDPREFGLVRCRERVAIDPRAHPPVAKPGLAESPRSQWLRSVMAKARDEMQPGNATEPTHCTLRESASPQPSFALLSSSHQQLGDTQPANPRLRVVTRSEGARWNWDGSVRSRLATTTTSTDTDDVGNTLKVVETTTDPRLGLYGTTTTNTFGQDNRTTWLLGRLTYATVVSTAPDTATQLGMLPSTAGGAASASEQSGTAPTVSSRPPLSPAVLAAILQLLLEP